MTESISNSEILKNSSSAPKTQTHDDINSDTDNDVCPLDTFDDILKPDDLTVVSGALDEDKVKALAKAGVEHVINLQTLDELGFDEEGCVLSCGMTYSHLPIADAKDLKQVNLLAFDRILRQYHGKKIAIHCKTGNRVGAAVALRAGWLRGRKMDTAMARGRAHGLTTLEDEVHNRLLVPR